MKIVINKCYGKFGLSHKACQMLDERGYQLDLTMNYRLRTNSSLIDIVEQLGDGANGLCSKLKIIEIPDNATDWTICSDAGVESVVYVVNGIMHTTY